MHERIGQLPIRDRATAAGLVQLCAELRNSGLLTDDAMERVKDAIGYELTEQAPRSVTKQAFRCDVHNRLNKVFERYAQVRSSNAAFGAEIIAPRHLIGA
jgi:hypothetical protein